ncbi:hypothetical protein [uncultured Winogradskyella sp.]|uniref:hypothetical protein n=1 Tax=uncultured Winogradskyella sp. TaxID=395353 RepID=UPI00263A2B24|nr:hypothetical protein [uncultured Winogradskyella sp.]
MTFISCKKDEDDAGPTDPIDQLPPATQTGEGTFGCLVNGEPFVDNSGFFNCFYQLVDGEYYFGIGSDNEQANLSQIIIGSNNSQIITNTPIDLNENTDMQFYGEINLDDISGDFITTNLADGTIVFTNFNTNSNIVSALFEFTIQIPSTEETFEITEGRFDSFFTQ